MEYIACSHRLSILYEGALSMKKFISIIVLMSFFSTTALYANSQIQSKHKNMKKDGKTVNCAYCHTQAKIAKLDAKKGETPKFKKGAGWDLSKVDKISLCTGSGCHPVKK